MQTIPLSSLVRISRPNPCFSRICRNSIQLECLTSITAEEAIEAVRDQLKKVKVKAKVEAQARSPLKIFTQP